MHCVAGQCDQPRLDAVTAYLGQHRVHPRADAADERAGPYGEQHDPGGLGDRIQPIVGTRGGLHRHSSRTPLAGTAGRLVVGVEDGHAGHGGFWITCAQLHQRGADREEQVPQIRRHWPIVQAERLTTG